MVPIQIGITYTLNLPFLDKQRSVIFTVSALALQFAVTECILLLSDVTWNHFIWYKKVLALVYDLLQMGTRFSKNKQLSTASTYGIVWKKYTELSTFKCNMWWRRLPHVWLLWILAMLSEMPVYTIQEPSYVQFSSKSIQMWTDNTSNEFPNAWKWN